MCKLITDYFKRSCSSTLSTEEPFTLSTVETSFSPQRTESDAQTSRIIHIYEEKSTNENNESIPVQCQPGPDYPFPMKQFGKGKCSCKASWFKNFSWLTIPTAIKDYLIRMQLSLNDLRAQAYDGASNMFGKNTGVSVQIAAGTAKSVINPFPRAFVKLWN